jgi:hypothetical protein
MDDRELAIEELKRRDVWRYVEPSLTMVTSALAEPIAGVAGIAGAVLPGQEGQGADWVDMTTSALTYLPQTPQGQAGLQAVGDSILGYAGEAFEDVSERSGDFVYDLTGSPALAAAAYSAPTAALEMFGVRTLGKAGQTAAKANLGTLRSGAGPSSLADNFDFDFPITHMGDVTDGIESGGVFDGLFGSAGDTSQGGTNSGSIETTFYPRKGRVADVGEIDLDYNKSIATLKKEFPDADAEKIDLLYEITAEDRNVFAMDENPLDEYGFDDLGEASWEAQRIRGKIAADQDFDAIAMNDEHGISYLIPHGSKAKKGR